MRYSEVDLQIEDIMWFGIDVQGHIIAFTSGGYGCVPEFVCRSKEETQKIENFFMNELQRSTSGKLLLADNGSKLTKDAILLAEKGVFSYDVSKDGSRYNKIAVPKRPLNLNLLPKRIQNVIRDHKVDTNAEKSKYVIVEHAY
ncbi:hypothetical protein [Lactobacillus equicursoris]|uniref:hypothetical protein n=1 Tax=Lactobacillus equicursoris TaxID=420645 RepID=UPI00242EF607|nr:hypothetical protein [Lactobacillus equicursoris]MDD6385771.1 hypothetical protein [Lactobacillus equicursoris]